MSVLDLKTGKIVQDAPDVAASIDAPRSDPHTFVDPLSVTPTPFPEERGETRAAEELPELGRGGLLSDADPTKIAAIAPVLLTTPDNSELADIVLQNFPNISKQFSPAGEIILANNDTGAKIIVNKPGLSRLDLVQGLGIAAAFTPAARGATLLPTLPAKVFAGVGLSGLTQNIIESIQEAVGGTLDEDEINLAASLGGVAEVVVPAIQAFRQTKQAAKVGTEAAQIPEVRQQIQAGKESVGSLAEVTGEKVGLFQAQQTQLPSELLKQRLLPQLDAGSKVAAEALENQNKETFDATISLLDQIAPPESVATGAKRFKTASEKALEAGKQRRQAATSDLFKEATRRGANTDVTPVRSILTRELKESVPGQQQSTLRGVLKSLKGIATEEVPTAVEGGGLGLATGKKTTRQLQPSLKQLDRAKDKINALLEKTAGSAEARKTKRILVEVKNKLIDQMEVASPIYKEAMDRFRELSPAVQELEDSIIGQISKIDDVNIKNIAQRIFDPKNAATNPTIINNAKKVIDKIDPGAWDDLLRVEVNRRVGGLEQLIEDIPGELVGNVPGQLRRALFGNPSQREALLSGMDKSTRENFVFLDDVLRRASTGRQAGSPTTPFKEALEKLRGVGLVIRDTIFKPLETLQKTGERGLFDRNVKALTDVMFDTRFERQLNKLKKLNPNSPAAARAMTQLLRSAQEEQ